MTTKDKVLKTINDLPRNASIEDAMERLYFLHKVENGIEQANSGKKVSHVEAKKRLKKWLK